jgi:hypothetical protein
MKYLPLWVNNYLGKKFEIVDIIKQISLIDLQILKKFTVLKNT